MALLASYIVPHPPLAVPAVGRGEECKIASTLAGYEDVAQRIAALQPDVIVIISPHTAYYADWILIAGGSHARGDLAQFRAPQVELNLTYADAFRTALEEECQAEGIPAGRTSDRAQALDHGMMVPLYYLEQAYPSSKYKAVSVGGSALPREDLLVFGACIARVAQEQSARCVLLVSGDLSHKLKDDGPYGFDPAGPEFDGAFERIVATGTIDGFATLDPRMCEDAAECGLSGFVMMVGAIREAERLSGIPFTSELLSHEGPFGVGYGVAAFERVDAFEIVNASESEAAIERKDSEPMDIESATIDPLVALAIQTVRSYVTDGTVPDAPTLPAEEPERAGCFVSIHTNSTDALRGCIGTIEPVQTSLAEEIIANAISASTRDPRFDAITPEELDDLTISVDVLFPPEPTTLDQLDPRRYGVIVSQGYRRGLLLPDLEGVDTVEEQVRIAALKAGIDPADVPDNVELERFEVIRHE